MNPTKKSELRFVATIKKVNVTTPKKSTYGESTGGVEIVLSVSVPTAPSEPYKPYQLNSELPAAPRKTKKESDEEFAQRVDNHKKLAAAKREAEAEWEKKQQQHQHQLEALTSLRIQYAQLVGMVAIFGSSALTVTLAPRDQNFLPGFAMTQGPTLLGAPPGDDDNDEGAMDESAERLEDALAAASPDE